MEARGFASVTHASVIRAVVESVLQGTPCIALVGPPGSGKTTVARFVRNELASRGLEVLSVSRGQGDRIALRDVATQVLGKPETTLVPEDTEKLFDLLTSGEAATRRVLMIDDAETLEHGAVEYLRLSSRLAIDAAPQLIFIGRPELSADTASHAVPLAEMIVANWELARLRDDQAREFLDRMLGSEGVSPEATFDEGVLDALVRHGDGSYGRIVSLLALIRLRSIAEAVRQPSGKVRLTTRIIDEAAALLGAKGPPKLEHSPLLPDPAADHLRIPAATGAPDLGPLGTVNTAAPGAVAARGSRFGRRYRYAAALAVLLAAAGAATYGVWFGYARRADAVVRSVSGTVIAAASALPITIPASPAPRGDAVANSAEIKAAEGKPVALALAAPDQKPAQQGSPPQERQADLPRIAAPVLQVVQTAPAATSAGEIFRTGAQREKPVPVPPIHQVTATPTPRPVATTPPVSPPVPVQPQRTAQTVAPTVAQPAQPQPTTQTAALTVAQPVPPHRTAQTAAPMAAQPMQPQPTTQTGAQTVPGAVPVAPSGAAKVPPAPAGAAGKSGGGSQAGARPSERNQIATASPPRTIQTQPEAVQRPAAAATPPPDAGEVPLLLSRADQMLAIGDLEAARLLYEQAADFGSARAAIAAGKTYDPDYLASIQASGVSPDRAMAATWYRKGAVLGYTDGNRLAAAVEARAGN